MFYSWGNKPREVESLVQGRTAGKWQSQDRNLCLLVVELLGTFSHLNDTDTTSVSTGRQVEGDPEAHLQLFTKHHSNNDESKEASWSHLQTRPREVVLLA